LDMAAPATLTPIPPEASATTTNLPSPSGRVGTQKGALY
jgi:hypothetical protein